MSTRTERRMGVVARHRTAILLVAGAAVAWAFTVERMRGMDAGPGTDLGGLGWYLGIWVTRTAAMMLPSAVRAAGQVARLGRRDPAVRFVAGYLAVLDRLWARGVRRLPLPELARYRLVGLGRARPLARRCGDRCGGDL